MTIIHNKKIVPIISHAKAAFQQLPTTITKISILPAVANAKTDCRKLTDITLLQPSQRIQTRARKLLRLNVKLTVPVDAPTRSEQLDARLDQGGQPQDEQDEGADNHDAGEELALADETEDEDEEEDCEGGDGDGVWEQPVAGGQHDRSRGGVRTEKTDRTNHGVPSCICCWTVMKKAKIPSTVADAARKMMSQKLSCASGQWYFFRRSTTTTSVIVSGEV